MPGIESRIFSTSGPVTLPFKEVFVFLNGNHGLPVGRQCRKNTGFNVEGFGVYSDHYILRV